MTPLDFIKETLIYCSYYAVIAGAFSTGFFVIFKKYVIEKWLNKDTKKRRITQLKYFISCLTPPTNITSQSFNIYLSQISAYQEYLDELNEDYERNLCITGFGILVLVPIVVGLAIYIQGIPAEFAIEKLVFLIAMVILIVTIGGFFITIIIARNLAMFLESLIEKEIPISHIPRKILERYSKLNAEELDKANYGMRGNPPEY